MQKSSKNIKVFLEKNINYNNKKKKYYDKINDITNDTTNKSKKYYSIDLDIINTHKSIRLFYSKEKNIFLNNKKLLKKKGGNEDNKTFIFLL